MRKDSSVLDDDQDRPDSVDVGLALLAELERAVARLESELAAEPTPGQ